MKRVLVLGLAVGISACADGAVSDSRIAGGNAALSRAAWIDDPTLPLIYNASGASDAHVKLLAQRALSGLGFAAPEAPNHDDRVFVGNRYLAWIDQTGFYGKINGLWTLDGAAADALDFVVHDPDGRPVNLFVPGENGEGRFAGGYKGAEHVEFPSRVPEANDNPNCKNTDWCNQYGLNEAPLYTNPKIPWWSACNPGSISFSTKFDPILIQPLSDGGLKLVYEGALVKQADGDGNYDGDACHADYLFPDGVRRRVLLHVGYELHPDSDDVDRTMQIVNPAGNPSFAGDMSLIGGFVMTAWPNTHYLKRLNRFWRPESSAITLNWGGTNVPLPAATWTDLHARPVPTSDVVVGWANQPLTFGSIGAYAAGRTATIFNVGPSDNGDVGGCLCVVHGGIEMGGGLIHAGVSLPIAGGQSTIEAKRRLTVPTESIQGTITSRSYDVIHQLSHAIGRAEADGWSAATAPDSQGYMVYGPYAKDWGGGAVEAVYQLMVDNNSADDGVVLTLDLNDFDTNTIIASRDVHRREFRAAHAFQRFTLDANLDGRSGHRMEVRVHWSDISYVKVGSVTVNLSDF